MVDAAADPEQSTHKWSSWWQVVAGWSSLRQHLPEVISAVLVLLLAVLLLRAIGWGFAIHTAEVAARDLDAGRVLSRDDVTTGQVGPDDSGEAFDLSEHGAPSTDLTGLILARAVQRGHPLRPSDLTRQQVVALRDIPAGALIDPVAVGLSWSTYKPGARLRLEDVLGYRALHAIRNSDVLHDLAIDSDPARIAQARQVVIRRATDLLPFQVVETADIATAITLQVAGSFDSIEKVVGRALVRRVSPGTTLLEEHLSSGPARNQLLRVSVAAGGIGAGVQCGALVSLLLEPRDRSATAPTPVVIQNVSVAEVVSRSDGTATVAVEVRPTDLATALPLLGASEVFVLLAR